MEYKIYPSDNACYIRLDVTGEINRKSAMQQNLEAHALGKKLGIERYLVDMTGARNTDSTLNQYQFAYKDMREASDIDKQARVALVVAKGDHSHDFIETVARNSGLNVVLFTDMELAVSFLER
jgi:hypothetical protein